jgi:hypothetical protein
MIMSEDEKELAVYHEVFNSAAKQISESRSFFEKMYKTTLGAILLIATVGIGTFYWLVGQKYADIEATVARKTNEQIAVLEQQIRKRVEDEFKTEKMKALIRSVAQDQTKSGLSDVITRAVGDQVQAAIKAESPRIQQTVIAQTKKSVSELAPTIDRGVKEKTAEAEGRVQSRIAQWEDVLQAGNLAILAKNGSGEDYDKLMALTQTTQNPQIRRLGITTHNQLFIEMSGIYVSKEFVEKKSEQELLPLLNDPNPLIRKAAIDGLVAIGSKAIVPALLEKAEHDPFMIVRNAAFHGLQTLTGEHIEALQIDRWQAWWKKNKEVWPPKK